MDTLITSLRAFLKREQLLSQPDELLVYECDGLPQHKARPRAVVFPHSTAEVAEVMRVLMRERVPFAPRGAGTGLSGGALALGRGVVIETARMRRLLKVDVENRLAVVETGIVNALVSRAVAPHGLHYAPDPSSQPTCTVGGNIAENAGGIHCLKYGTTVDHVLGARVVLSNGEVVDLGGATGEPAGYDLLGLFVGSEGTFGIATEATLRLTPTPPAVRTLLADFKSVDDASRAVSAIIAAGIIPAALEMVDGATIRAVEASVFAAGIPLDAEAALLVELDGLDAGLDEETAHVESICLHHGARTWRRAADEAERKKLWAARKGAFGAMGRISPDLMLQDAVVPRSRLPEVLAETYRIGAKYRLPVANVFHAGDGNLHPFICFDSRNEDEVRRVKEAGREMMETCVRAGGTITGEHGVGLDKSEYLPLIFSEADLRAMLRVRAAFDPHGLCNPGKIIPAPLGCGEARAVVASKAARRRETNGGGAISDTSEVEVRQADTHGFPSSIPLVSPALNATARTQTFARTGRAFDAARAADALASIVGAEHASAGETTKDVLTVEPGSFAEACEVLRLASSEGWTVAPQGAGTWLDSQHDSGRQRVNLFVKTTRLARLVEHEPADLVATAEAGLTLARFNEQLRRADQWLPLDPPDDGRATLGGVAATAASGAHAPGYGLVRSHVLGMRVALADGSLIRAGSRVVKNVAGYDLCKLFVGSYGTLGLILELTFKLRPLPAESATLIARSGDYASLLGAAHAVSQARLFPVAAELLSPTLASAVDASHDSSDEHLLLVRFAGTRDAVVHQTTRARELLTSAASRASIEMLTDDAAVWKNLAAASVRDGARLVWRASVPPTRLADLLALLEIHAEEDGAEVSAWQAGACDGRLRVSVGTAGDDDRHVRALEKLRRTAREAGGHLVLERAGVELQQRIDAWGAKGGALILSRRLKEQFDPGGTFAER
ncbi:MAG TPA: FAD-linked oxidase C-terminal domain-containing protein [Pyrinomonadaceae bacterium]|nr:FAD-linked oxidase C-terminal domain-containing protein [Pyrinomonadaceae bacterium]